jgi:hypothetical protein
VLTGFRSRSTQLGELLGAYSISEWVRALTLTLHVEPSLILNDLVQLLQKILHFDFFSHVFHLPYPFSRTSSD